LISSSGAPPRTAFAAATSRGTCPIHRARFATPYRLAISLRRGINLLTEEYSVSPAGIRANTQTQTAVGQFASPIPGVTVTGVNGWRDRNGVYSGPAFRPQPENTSARSGTGSRRQGRYVVGRRTIVGRQIRTSVSRHTLARTCGGNDHGSEPQSTNNHHSAPKEEDRPCSGQPWPLHRRDVTAAPLRLDKSLIRAV
jgi:hypothetical protein